MALRLFPLVAYLASLAYLVSWMIRLLQTIYQRVRSWAQPPRMILLLKTWSRVGEANGLVVYFVGILFGGLASLWLMHIFVHEWLLVIFVVLSVMTDEMHVSSTEMLLLEVIVFFDRLEVHIENHQDLFESLPNVIQELPECRVQKSILETVLRRRSGESFEKSLEAMRSIDSLLDEFVLSLQHSGWKDGPCLNIILNRLSERAGLKWDRASWCLLIKDKIKNYLQFSRSAFITALWVILISSSSALNRVMPDRSAIILAVLALSGLGFIFFLLLTRQGLRRSFVVSIFIIVMAAYANSSTVSLPAWIQIETISHQSHNIRDTDMVTSQISSLDKRLPESFLPSSFNKPPITGTSNTTSTLNPTAVVTMILNPPLLIPTPVISQDFNLCCLRSPQPR